MRTQSTAGKQHFVIWNGSLGMVVQVTLGHVEHCAGGPEAFLESPFDFVGPLNLDELRARGRLAFGACLILTLDSWRQDQADLRRDAHQRRRVHSHRTPLSFQREARDHRQDRAVLRLPLEGTLQASEIKAAFRRLAKTAHPDVGGSSELFQGITRARDALLAYAQHARP